MVLRLPNSKAIAALSRLKVRQRKAASKDIKTQLALSGLPPFEPEHRFHGVRRWAFDIAWPALKVAAEREGGTWMRGGGRHSRGAGYSKDCEKYSEAAILGWRVIRFTVDMEASGLAVDLIRRAIEAAAEGVK